MLHRISLEQILSNNKFSIDVNSKSKVIAVVLQHFALPVLHFWAAPYFFTNLSRHIVIRALIHRGAKCTFYFRNNFIRPRSVLIIFGIQTVDKWLSTKRQPNCPHSWWRWTIILGASFYRHNLPKRNNVDLFTSAIMWAYRLQLKWWRIDNYRSTRKYYWGNGAFLFCSMVHVRIKFYQLWLVPGTAASRWSPKSEVKSMNHRLIAADYAPCLLVDLIAFCSIA